MFVGTTIEMRDCAVVIAGTITKQVGLLFTSVANPMITAEDNDKLGLIILSQSSLLQM